MASVQHAAEAATSTSGDQGTTPLLLRNLHFLSHLVASVALTDRDDVLRLLCHLNSLVSRRADAIQVTVAESLGHQVRSAACPLLVCTTARERFHPDRHARRLGLQCWHAAAWSHTAPRPSSWQSHSACRGDAAADLDAGLCGAGGRRRGGSGGGARCGGACVATARP